MSEGLQAATPPVSPPARPPARAAAHLEGAHEGLIHAHHGARVVELPAVVGRREEGHELALGEELVAVLHHLWGLRAQLGQPHCPGADSPLRPACSPPRDKCLPYTSLWIPTTPWGNTPETPEVPL